MLAFIIIIIINLVVVLTIIIMATVADIAYEHFLLKLDNTLSVIIIINLLLIILAQKFVLITMIFSLINNY